MQIFILFAVLALTYLMVTAKRIPALIRGFRYQSFFLFLATLVAAFSHKQLELFMVAALVLLVKVFLIPLFLGMTAKRIKVDEDLGLFVNPQLSLISALALTYGSWVFSQSLGLGQGPLWLAAVSVSFALIFIGAFLMISRMKAFAQVIGLLVMENGIFLLASSISGGMPFFVEIAIFFDVFTSVIIMGLFVFRISRLFTHINVNQLSELKG